MKVAVLLSGGLDSTTALHWAKAQHDVCVALSFDYGSNHAQQELACACWQAKHLGVEHHVINISSIAKHLSSALLDGADAIPTGTDYNEENMMQTVVPFRNGIFLAIAAGIAESKGALGLVIAAHSGDHDIYPDCREEFMQSMSNAIRSGTYAALEILRPFIAMSKDDILKEATKMGVDLAHTYSCYCGGEHHCGECSTCIERKEAFVKNNIVDPTTYLA